MGTVDLLRKQESAGGMPAATSLEAAGSLFPDHETVDLRQRWSAIQGEFVDNPRDAVQQADELVASAIRRLTEVFAEEKSRLDRNREEAQDVSTEDLRQAFRRYRSFFDRLLSI